MRYSFPVFFVSATTALDCFLPLDVMFVQDTTGSFEDDLPNVVDQVPLIMASITGRFPESMFGVAEFRDKPYYPLGEASDYCYKLGEGYLTSRLSTFQLAYRSLYASGGADLPEAQFQALINVVLDPQVGWRPIHRGDDEDSVMMQPTGARIVILSTDAIPHLDGDMSKFSEFPDVPQGLPPNSGIISTTNVEYECLYQEYPSPEQLRDAFQSTDTSLIILTPNDPAIVPVWTYVNSVLLGQPDQFYQFIESDSSDIFEAILRALDGFRVVTECPTTTTTTTTPTTATPFTGTTTEYTGSTTLSTASTTTTATSVATSSTTDDEEQCSCPGSDPCNLCNDAVNIRFADKPVHMQIIVDNE